MIERLRAVCKAVGGQKVWAARNGISFSYLSDVINYRRTPGDSVLRSLNLQRSELTYEPRQPREIAIHDEDGVTLATAWAS
ncbi:transcriptional regulator [Methylobacterium sp. E-025]|uniref:transcriptional regulator n=1 Tax=unclassified Methylobacterium TaxID=2615210 RepID=UPI001FBA9BCE|nr:MULTISPECIES: transcriptional regulator [unclassified Methylobacterium]MCJ2039878.1 transcriptional regulator [Methylobacterium sp. J-059]MCJ2110613.1 transcriptional regulator [Methylobacterium sp. E-025]